jgi:hypothetical protein
MSEGPEVKRTADKIDFHIDLPTIVIYLHSLCSLDIHSRVPFCDLLILVSNIAE